MSRTPSKYVNSSSRFNESPHEGISTAWASAPAVTAVVPAPLADWIAGRMVNPRPIIRELPIVWRDDLELGQVVLLVEDAVYDIELRCLVIGIRERHTPRDGAEMWVTLRVLDAQDLPVTHTFGDGPYGAGPYGGTSRSSHSGRALRIRGT